jgi:hypothetical protein
MTELKVHKYLINRSFSSNCLFDVIAYNKANEALYAVEINMEFEQAVELCEALNEAPVPN